MTFVHIFNRGEEPISKRGEEPKSEDHMVPKCEGKIVPYTVYKPDGTIPDGRKAFRCEKCGAFSYTGKVAIGN